MNKKCTERKYHTLAASIHTCCGSIMWCGCYQTYLTLGQYYHAVSPPPKQHMNMTTLTHVPPKESPPAMRGA